MSSALKLVPNPTATTEKRRKPLDGSELRSAFERGLDQHQERPAAQVRRPGYSHQSGPVIYRVTYQVVWGAESDDYAYGNAAKTETVLAFDVTEAITKVREAIEADCTQSQLERNKHIAKRRRMGLMKKDEDRDAHHLIHFRPFHVEIVDEIDHI